MPHGVSTRETAFQHNLDETFSGDTAKQKVLSPMSWARIGEESPRSASRPQKVRTVTLV